MSSTDNYTCAFSNADSYTHTHCQESV